MSDFSGEQEILPFGGPEPGWAHPILGEARAALARLEKRGGATSYSDAHLVARLHLGLLDAPAVACAHCGATDYEVAIQAALDWPEVPADRLRIDYAGHIFSSQPVLDYIPLCIRCHRRHDSWRKALPSDIRAA